MESMAETDELEQEEREHALRVMFALERKRDAWVKAMQPKHRTMVEDWRQYEAKPRRVASTKVDHGGADGNGPPRLHATRALTDLIEARIADMLLPASQSPWRLEGEPEQDEEAFVLEGGTIVPPELRGQHVINAVRDAEKKLRDQFAEAKFGAKARGVIRDACRFGFGLFIGPIAAVKRREKYVKVPVQSGFVGAIKGALGLDQPMTVEVKVEFVDESIPGVEQGDPFRFFPEPVEDIAKASGFFYYDTMSESELREFADHPNARREDIGKLLSCKPDHGLIGSMVAERNQLTGFVESLDDRYVVWRYYGCMSRDDLMALNCECDPLDPLPMVQMRFCQGKVIEFKLSPNKGTYRIPAHVYTPFPEPGSWWGMSVPFQCRDSDKGAQAAYEMALLNGAVSAGPIVITRPGLKPADGKMEIRGPKFLVVDDNDRALNDFVHVELIDNRVDMLMQFMDRHLQMMSEDLNLPQFTNPEVNKPTNTASGMAMWMNAQTVVQRRAAAAFDDCIEPLIQGFVRWNRLYSDLTVDVKVIPLGQSELLVKDIEIQNSLQFVQMAQANPQLSRLTDFDVLAQHIGQQWHLPDGAILSPEKAAEREQSQPQDPAQEVARVEAEMKQRDMALREEKLRAEIADKERDDAYRAQDRQLDYETRMRELSIKEQEQQLAALKMQGEREMRMIELAQNKELKFEDIAAKLKIAEGTQALTEFSTSFKGRLDAEKVAVTREEMALKTSPINPSNTGI